jgi:uncharacterized protein YerC
MESFDDYLPNLLTKKELKVLQRRYRIIQLLKTNLTYREIAQQMGISTTTVVHLNQRLKTRRKRAIHSEKQRKIPWKIG